ncbi:MAG: phosphate signaling complex protein PhoU [Eubacteriales bacterium]
MVRRKGFEMELEKLHKEILIMSSMVEQMLRDAIRSLKEKDIALASDVIKRDDIIDQKEIDIQEVCVQVIATQQPVATDLRLLTSVFKIITNLERIADHAVNIAEITIELKDEKYMKALIDLPRLSEIALEVVRLSIDAYVHQDIRNMSSIIEKEGIIDDLYKQIYRELTTYMLEDPKYIQQASKFTFIASALERVGDHGTNIFESVNYIVTGKYMDLKDCEV